MAIAGTGVLASLATLDRLDEDDLRIAGGVETAGGGEVTEAKGALDRLMLDATFAANSTVERGTRFLLGIALMAERVNQSVRCRIVAVLLRKKKKWVYMTSCNTRASRRASVRSMGQIRNN